MTALRALLCALLAVSAGAYAFAPAAPEGGEDGISASDGKGTIYTVYNLFDGRNSSIQVNRLQNGGLAWSVEHADGVREKAAAAGVDGDGNLYIVGERSYYKERYMFVMKYSPSGAFVREVADNADGCRASAVTVDKEGWVTVGGMCKYPRNRPARLVKYDSDLNYYWMAEYDRGARNYLRGLASDVRGLLFATIETVSGDITDGSYRTVTAIYSPEGRLEDER
ncbi:hypothetical protein EPO15_16035 [bacterium]|nr:MAG: hypothetical protein EPO15_16035 [bacterium]